MSAAITRRLGRLEGGDGPGPDPVERRRRLLAMLGAPDGLTFEEEEEWLRPMTSAEWVAKYCVPAVARPAPATPGADGDER